MGTIRLNKNGHFTGRIFYIKVLDVMFYGACASTIKNSVCHGNKVDYSLYSSRSMVKYMILFIVVIWKQ